MTVLMEVVAVLMLVPSPPRSVRDAIGNRSGHRQSFFLVQVLETLMPSDVETIDEFQVGITELRDSLGFTVQEVARSGTPVAIRRFRKTEVILVPLAEWRRLKQLETDLGEPDPFDFDDDESDIN